jgi:DNA-directed RNA polymerase subunit M/transcription elongation factor TFIIS
MDENKEEVYYDWVTCPKCDSDDTAHYHHDADALADECDYWVCHDCGFQWGHE